MNYIQLELNIENNSSEQIELSLMQKQIDKMEDSMGKVRRRLFSELGEMKKICVNLKKENEELKSILKELKNEKTEWTYEKEGWLFGLQEYRQAIG